MRLGNRDIKCCKARQSHCIICQPCLDTFKNYTCKNFDKMQIILKQFQSHPCMWERKYSTVRAREKSVAEATELVVALGSSFR